MSISRGTRAARFTCSLLVLLAPLVGCGDRTEATTHAGLPPLPDELPHIASSAAGNEEDALWTDRFSLIAEAGREAALSSVTVDYPLTDSVFPPDLVPPTILWHDDAEDTGVWLFEFRFADEAHLYALVPGPLLPPANVDPEAFGLTNEPYEPTPYQRSARHWTPSATVWDQLRGHATTGRIAVTVFGLKGKEAPALTSRGTTTFSFTEDPIGAPIFYRDVPLMPAEGKRGRIQPLGKGALPLIRWRLRDLREADSHVVLSGLPTCANCHSFSQDGSTMGMDVDGPQGDKGSYMIAPVEKAMVIEEENVITWNSFEEKPEGHKTIGFLSQVSPDGRYSLTTLNESLYVANFTDHKFLQVFYPTRGILAWYDTETQEMKALPGADDPEFVHTNGTWSPDGKWIVFSRAKAFDPYFEGQQEASYPNDPNEPDILYDLYRIPFNDGRGGTPEPIPGAVENGASNTFPKVSPDGRWIVWTRCRNGQLMRPDGRLWIVPFEGGDAREMRCNTALMNSWHSFSPNSRWMVFSSKVNTPYTQLFLTHIDEAGNDSPPLLIPNSTAANRAANIPEFLNRDADALETITIPAVRHFRFFGDAQAAMAKGQRSEAVGLLEQAIEMDATFHQARTMLGWIYLEQRDAELALAQADAVVSQEPAHYEGLKLKGEALLRLDRVDEAIDVLEQAASLEGPVGKLHVILARLLRQRGLRAETARDFDTAVAAYRRSLHHARADLDTHGLLVRTLRTARRDAQAVVELRQLVAEYPDLRTHQVDLAWILATSTDDAVRDGAQAARIAEQIVGLDDKPLPQFLDVLAASYAEAGRFAEAIETATRAIDLTRKRDPRLARAIQERLTLYESGQAYRDAPEEE